MKEFKETVGIDVSKETLDARLHKKGAYLKVENSKKGFSILLQWVKETTELPVENVLWCFEHTGMYSLNLSTFLAEKNIPFVMVSALEIKKSLGIVRGKNDKVDAARIAQYAYEKREKIKLTLLPSTKLIQLKELLSLRERMVVQRAGYISSLKEFKFLFPKSHNPQLFKTQENIIKVLDQNIKSLEKEILELIESEPEIKKVYSLITSVVGIGLILAANLIVTTNRFTSFENSRKLACYSGVAPFKKQSGKSIKSNARVSHYANKKMKALLDRAAHSAIQHDPELKIYYERRIAKGKSKMSTINIVRNKILHRVFAVVKRGTPYVKIHRYAA